jgi:hypothetical protein
LIKSHFAVRENSDDWCQLQEKKKIPATAVIPQQQKTTSTTTTKKNQNNFSRRKFFFSVLCDVLRVSLTLCVYLKENFLLFCWLCV